MSAPPRKPIVATADNTVIAGNHTLLAARHLGWTHVAVAYFDDDPATARAYALADNRTAALGGYDYDALADMLAEVEAVDAELLTAASFSPADLRELAGGDGERGAGKLRGHRPTLADRFLVPPFTVLNARSGWWRDRKRHWLGYGIQSEVGRSLAQPRPGQSFASREREPKRELYLGRRQDGAWQPIGYDHDPVPAPNGRTGALTLANEVRDSDFYRKKAAVEAELGHTISRDEFVAEYWDDPASDTARPESLETTGTSVFDPVLCELIYRWFTAPGAAVLDPWAGGSVRGLVAAKLGREYTGCELRAEQVEANQAQVLPILGPVPAHTPRWLTGDCLDLLPTLPAGTYDLAFGCPPFYDLEIYSEDQRDLSAMDTATYDRAYRQMIALTAERLAPDAFACFVVSGVRDKAGHIRDLRGLTVAAAAAAGLALYNEAVLLTPIGSLPVRAAGAFERTRVLGRAHQDVLVFVKGDRRAVTNRCGAVAGIAEALAAVEPDEDNELLPQ